MTVQKYRLGDVEWQLETSGEYYSANNSYFIGERLTTRQLSLLGATPIEEEMFLLDDDVVRMCNKIDSYSLTRLRSSITNILVDQNKQINKLTKQVQGLQTSK